MKRAAKTTLILLGATALLVLSAVSIAVAQPGGWEAWRVALAIWPAAGLTAAFFWILSGVE
jgi:hypothetical protein